MVKRERTIQRKKKRARGRGEIGERKKERGRERLIAK